MIKYLMDHKDLGIHTEMLSDGLMELMLAGVATGENHSPLQGGHCLCSRYPAFV